MNSVLKRRLSTIEKKLGLDTEVVNSVVEIIKSEDGDSLPRYPPEPVEQWLTYKQQRNNPVHNGRRTIIVCAKDELQKRKKVAKGNKR